MQTASRLRDRKIHRMGTTGFYREVDIPDDFEEHAVAPMAGIVTLPRHVAWSGQGALDLDDPVDRNYAYETLLAEGTANDVRTYVDRDLLVQVWDELCLAPHVREQWGTWLRGRDLIA